MIDLDLKDRKILYELDLNCRQSNAKIGKKIGLSREMVNYRIKRMEEDGIITGYWTAINTFKLGYYVFRIYINLIDVNKDIKTEIINYFIKNEDVWAVLTQKGPVDLDIVLWVKDLYKFNQYWINILQIYGKYFIKTTISILTSVLSCKKSYLLVDNKNLSDRLFYECSCEGHPLQIDEVDYKILNEIALNARIPLIEIAKKLNSSSQTINYRIKNLQKKKIIQAFRININPLKIGLQGCAVDLYLNDQKKRTQILEYLLGVPNIYDLPVMNIGWSDLTFQAYIKDIKDITEIIENIETKFPNTIRRYDYWMEQVSYIERWLPKMNKKDFKKGGISN